MASGKKSEGKKGKRQRKHKFTDPLDACRRNLKREVKKAEKKVAKLLRLHEEGRKRAKDWAHVNEPGVIPPVPVYVDEEKTERKKKKHVRLQGMKPRSERHKRLQSHIQNLKNRMKEVAKQYTPNTYSKKVSLV